MNEFLLAIHRDLSSKDASPSPEQMQAAIKPFQDWIGGIAAQNKLVAPPKRWDTDGRVVKQNNTVLNGPYAEIKESLGGLFLIRAADYDEAVEIAKGCPIIQWGAVVEVRMAIPPAQ
ncbi:YciI family protein [Larkinella terrae]|uniref:Transcription initiation protein n=1 Tax=Larkinella terrae TaxID=2025311 RepID=A0A7K0EER1_9BACT|nr:YciI family protein [Larkinella terrae]MRS59946.1 transcription initiation protein [Larkinella terrae]